MFFNSLSFIFLFLPISFFIYVFLNKQHLTIAALVVLMLGSLFFYAWWDAFYLPLLLVSIGVNFLFGRFIFQLTEQKKRKLFLIAGVVFNIALLAYFKYTGFILSNINELTTWLFKDSITVPTIILPIGISFFTFTQIAFLVDVYQRKASEYRLLHYTLFVSYFPHLLAGPIIHHAEMMPQFTGLKQKVLNYKNIYQGLVLFSMGLFKKVVLADTLAVWANSGYADSAHLGLLQAWSTVLSYTFQLYFDFSGYTDMAIGMSLLFNIRLPINFNSPYKSLSIRDFWQRWHITLSRFLRNYLYIFMGGNRAGQSKMLRNLLIIFLVGGIWHGAGWTFIVWGILHGLAMSIRSLWQKAPIVLPKMLAWFITFAFINVTWVFFRADSLKSAVSLLVNCFDNHHPVTLINPIIMLALAASFFVCVFAKNTQEIVASKVMNWKITPIFMGGLFLLSVYVLIIRNSSAFLYFQF